MKKAILDIKINVPDNFEGCGDCKHCPFRTEEIICIQPGWDQKEITCKIGFTQVTCPIYIMGGDY